MSSYNLYNVMAKEVLLTIRTRPEIREEFRKVAQLRGATMSTLIHQFMVSLIREEKEREPDAFILKAKGTSATHLNLTQVQEHAGLHRNTSNTNQKEGTKQAEDIIKKIDVDNSDTDYGEFENPDADLKK